jgi:polyhydroxyalkanoate synthase
MTEALTDIAERSHRLVEQQIKRIQTDDGYQVVDARTVSKTFQDLAIKAIENPGSIVKEQVEFWSNMTQLWQRTSARMLLNQAVEPVIKPAPEDKRFKNDAWIESFLFDYMKQCYLLVARHGESAIRNIEGVDPETARKAQFYTRQMLDALSPTNCAATNPVVLKATVESRGENLINGLRHMLEDLERGEGRLNLKMSDLSAFRLGENIAASPGKVVYESDLMQLIQYQPTTETVHARPLLIVPPWINKFYILDLKPKNSFIKWAVDQGHTVFVISWINPGKELAAKDFTDYMRDGPLAALDAIEASTGEETVNIVGYCIGGTLVASTLAYMAAKGDGRISSATLFTSLLDFSDVGDIRVFIDDEQLELLDDHMDRLGYLEGHHMGEAFNLLRENDLIWSFVINNYLLGRDPIAFDLLYWNSDSTRMPAAMHSFYLRNMYHRNLLKEPGGITLADVPIDLRQVKTPTYFLSAREDHIAPWRSTYAGTQIFKGPVRFVLGASGHVAGVVNPPAANKYGYWTNDVLPPEPEAWLAGAKRHDGSWWVDWARWAADYNGPSVPARVPGDGNLKPIEDAPGAFVKLRTN